MRESLHNNGGLLLRVCGVEDTFLRVLSFEG